MTKITVLDIQSYKYYRYEKLIKKKIPIRQGRFDHNIPLSRLKEQLQFDLLN